MNGLYQVSNLGRVKSLQRKTRLNINKEKDAIKKELILKQGKGGIKRNYFMVVLHKNCIPTNKMVHRLVAETFIDNPNNYKEVNHIDENTFNNCVSNLEWCNRKYNINYGTRTKRAKYRISKKVFQYDKNKNLINVWESIREASRKTKINVSNICRCCNGKLNSAGGYIWKYK